MYTLHHRPDSASTIIRLALEDLGQPYRLSMVERDGPLRDTPAYRGLQPLGLVPALETPDGPMFETAAILLWLSETHHALAPAPGTPGRAAFLKWFIFTTGTIHPTLLQLFYPERVGGAPAAPAVLSHAAQRMQSYLALLNTLVAEDAPGWLAPQAPSILGHYLAVMMRWLNQLDPAECPGLASTHTPALHALLLAYEDRPAARTVAAAEELGPTPFSAP